MAHTKFGVSMSKLCRDTASDAVWHLSRTFVDAINKKTFCISTQNLYLIASMV